MSHTVDNQSFAKALRVVVLQNVQHLARRRDGHAGILPLLAGLEVNHQAQRLDARRHHVRDPLHHVEQVVNLARARIRVLSPRVEVLARPALLVEADNDLLARLLLRRNVLWRELVEAVFAAPRQRSLDSLGGVVDVPLGRAQVPKQTVAGDPGPVVVRERAALVLFLLARHICP